MRISSPTSFLVFFFTFSLFNQIPCALSKQQGLGSCKSLFQCGNITAGFPFWGGNRGESCGHPLLALHCNTNITSLMISNQEFHVLHIDQIPNSYYNTLTLARPDLLGPFCSARFITTNFLPDIFEFSDTSKSLTVYYFCDSRLRYLSSYTCPGKGLVSISQNPDYQYSCQNSFSVKVPRSFVPQGENMNLTHLETVLRKGFEVLLLIDMRPCRDCLSSGGICGYYGNKQVCCKGTLASEVKCTSPYPSGFDETYEQCNAPFSCGDGHNLWYPFWIPGREECGHPDFKVNCSRGFPEVNIDSINYRVLVSDFSRARLSRSDYANKICTLDPLDKPFKGMTLPYVPGTEMLTLYYDCPHASVAFQYIGDLGCVNHAASYYVTKNISSPLLDGSRERVNNLTLLCRRNVSIPASGQALVTLQKNPTLDRLRAAIEQGFELGRDQNCSRCEESLGVCGYNQISSTFVCYCSNGSLGIPCTKFSREIRHGFFYGPEIGSVVAVVLFAFLVLLTPSLLNFLKIRISENLRYKKLEANIPFKHYSFAQAKRMTNSFAEVVGKGGFGIVYQGTLSDGRKVAVKVLKEAKGDGEDFINEVASMSKTSHVNIVSLLGFCVEGSKRAVIYEFVGNGSLDEFISGKTSIDMDWKTLYEIALGVARGLEYLHHGCKTRIVHFDIKPHNVLLDEDLCPKISDFGLARLCEGKESTMPFKDTRGTIGYIAPEMFSGNDGSVSHKSDVYSYGMLVLEMIGARNKERGDQNSASNASSIYFPDWVYTDLEKGNYKILTDNGISSEEEGIAKKMTLVGLWCIQTNPADRPPMNKVVEMMEGNTDALEVPPKPVLQQIRAVPLPESSMETLSTSKATEDDGDEELTDDEDYEGEDEDYEGENKVRYIN